MKTKGFYYLQCFEAAKDDVKLQAKRPQVNGIKLLQSNAWHHPLGLVKPLNKIRDVQAVKYPDLAAKGGGCWGYIM